MARPTQEQLELLSRTERAAFEIGDVFVRRMQPFTVIWNSAFMGAAIWSCGGNRLHVRGLEHLKPFETKDARVLIVANHRSFFDLYVVTAVLYWRTRLPKRVLCPVRSTFFYDHPLGPAVNLAMSGMSMFPPILRDPKRGAFNRYSLERCVAELRTPGTVMGLHPEGTRNKGDDPYGFLPAQPGVGKIALDAKESSVIPVFIHGLSNDIVRELIVNWTKPSQTPLDVVFGPPVDLEDLRAQGSRPANAKRAADRCLLAIKKLAEQHRSSS